MLKRKRFLSLLMVAIFALSSMALVMGNDADAEPLAASGVTAEIDTPPFAAMPGGEEVPVEPLMHCRNFKDYVWCKCKKWW